MSGGSHNDRWCNLAALRKHVRDVREDAVRQRELCAEQRVRLESIWAQITGRDHHPLRPDQIPAPGGRGPTPAAAAVIAFAASAGGLAPLAHILSAFPDDLPAAVIVVLHAGPGSTLPDVLQPRCRLPVRFAESGATISDGAVYVARPLRHLIVNADRTLTVAEKGRVGFARPSADWLFETVAPTYEKGAIAVVLSGHQRDGARGVVRIRDAGGHVIVQEPDSCDANDMPNAAIRTGCAGGVLRPELIACAIVDRLQALDLRRARQDFDDPFAA